MSRTAFLLLCASMLLFAACGDGTTSAGSGGDRPPASPSPEDPVTQSPGDGTPFPTPSPVEPKPGQADVGPIPWKSAKVREDDRSVTIKYWTGVEPCYVLDHVEVDYGRRKVAITLFQGHAPDPEDVACIEIAVLATTIVELEEPLGGRRLVDGAPKS